MRSCTWHTGIVSWMVISFISFTIFGCLFTISVPHPSVKDTKSTLLMLRIKDNISPRIFKISSQLGSSFLNALVYQVFLCCFVVTVKPFSLSIWSKYSCPLWISPGWRKKLESIHWNVVSSSWTLARPRHWALQDPSPHQPPTESSTIRYPMLLQDCYQIPSSEDFPKARLDVEPTRSSSQVWNYAIFQWPSNPSPSFLASQIQIT